MSRWRPPRHRDDSGQADVFFAVPPVKSANCSTGPARRFALAAETGAVRPPVKRSLFRSSSSVSGSASSTTSWSPSTTSASSSPSARMWARTRAMSTWAKWPAFVDCAQPPAQAAARHRLVLEQCCVVMRAFFFSLGGGDATNRGEFAQRFGSAHDAEKRARGVCPPRPFPVTAQPVGRKYRSSAQWATSRPSLTPTSPESRTWSPAQTRALTISRSRSSTVA
jgi:hypothetical protein